MNSIGSRVENFAHTGGVPLIIASLALQADRGLGAHEAFIAHFLRTPQRIGVDADDIVALPLVAIPQRAGSQLGDQDWTRRLPSGAADDTNWLQRDVVV